MITLIGLSCLLNRRANHKTKRKKENKMKTNAQTGENQRTSYRDARYSSRRLCLSWLATLLLATSARAISATVQVDVGDGSPSFSPDDVTIQPGDTVEWTWHGPGNYHTVTSGANGTSSGLFDSSIHTAPFTFSFTFPNAGTFDYFCRPHYVMGMVGVVRVVGSTATPGTFGNISTRLRVETGDNVLIGGFIITGTQPKKIIVRAFGPSLPLAGALADPALELRDSSGGLITSNDNWRSDQQAEIIA